MSNKPSKLKKVEKAAVKMSNPKFSEPIYRKPTWKGSDIFTINGMQLQEIATLSSIFKGLISLSDEIIQTGEIQGSVKTQFVYGDGSPVSELDPRLESVIAEKDAEITEMRNKIEEYQKQLAELNEAARAKAEEVKKAESSVVEENVLEGK